jgi:hypothetical protein
MTKLNTDWIAGFIDGDGSFALERPDKTKSFYRPSLSIAQNDLQLLYKIKDYFGCGTVTRKTHNAWQYRCRSTQHFQEFIIPKLGKTPFHSIKQQQYQLICEQALPILLQKTTDDPLEKQKKLSRLEDLDRQIQISRTDTTYVNPNAEMSLDWFLGFFEAEGNIYMKIRRRTIDHTKSSTAKLSMDTLDLLNTKGIDIRIAFKVTQKNKPLLEKIQSFFNFGAIQLEREQIWKYNVEGIKNVTTHGYSLFRSHPLKGRKNLERVKLLSVIRILLKDGHKTPEGLAKIEKILSWKALNTYC